MNQGVELFFECAYIVVIVGFLIFLIIWQWGFDISRFGRWLKGSRITYFFPAGKREISRTSFPCRRDEDRQYIHGSVIEFNYGFFRWQSAIHGPAAKNWKIAGTYQAMNGWDCVELQDRLSIPVETALRIVNTYPSLQAMLDRIAELEKASVEPLAVLSALDIKMLDDKQRFRSPAGKEIHAHIRFSLREIFVSGITSNPTSVVAKWMERFECPEAKVVR